MSNKRVIVIGAGVGGLSAAIHARLNGDQVLILEQGQVGGKAAQIFRDGFKLDPGPSIIILPRIFKDVFRRASRNPDDYVSFERLNPVTRVFFEGQPFIDLPDGAEECFQVARQICEKDANSLQKLFQLLGRIAPHIERSIFQTPIHSPLQLLNPHLVAVGLQFAHSESYKAYIDRSFQSPLFRAFFYGFPSYGGQTYDSRAMGSLLIPYYMLTEGVFYPRGGVGAIPQAFERLARELGVEIRTDSKAAELVRSGKSISGVRIENAETESCDAVICNVDRLSAKRDLLGARLEVNPSMSYFTIHWALNRKLPDTSHHMLLIPKEFEAGFELLYRRKEFPDPPIVYLNVTNNVDPDASPIGCTNLFAVISSPGCEPNLDWDEVQVRARTAILKALSHSGWQISTEDIIFERIQTPRYFESVHGNYKGSLYGPDESHRLFGGLFPLRCKDEHFRNLFYAGGSVQPGAGLPMVTLSGKFAADLVALS